MTTPDIFFGTFIAIMIGLLFHFVRGGKLDRLLIHVLTAIFAFFLGNYVGEWIHWYLWRFGTLNLFPAILATLVGLIATSILAGPEKPAHKKR